MNPEKLLIAGAALAAMMFVFAACDNGGGGDTPTPTQLEGQIPHATSTASQGAGRTGIEEVDAVIDAILSGDLEAYRALVSFRTGPCAREETQETIADPLCKLGEPEGTPVDFLPVLITGTCNTAARIQEYRADEVGPPPPGAFKLYAVHQGVPPQGVHPAVPPHEGGRRYTAVFTAESPDPRWAFMARQVLIEGGRILSENIHCPRGDTRAELVDGVEAQDFILPPQEQ